MVAAADETRPAFRLLVGLGVAGVVILAVGLAEFVHFEPSGQHSGLAVRITGVYGYDRRTDSTVGPSRDHFRTDEPFAARVDWSGLPPAQVVGAAWFSGGFGLAAGGVGPAPAGTLEARSVVPVNFGAGRFPSGRYEFVVERYAGGRAVEVLARTAIVVAGS